MASGRQFQSAIVLGKNENLKMSLLAYGTRNLTFCLILHNLFYCSSPSVSDSRSTAGCTTEFKSRTEHGYSEIKEKRYEHFYILQILLRKEQTPGY